MGYYLLTIKDRVEWVYNTYPDTIETDLCLLAIYENHFGKLTHQDVSSVKRAGRYWRQQTRFARTQDKIRHDLRTTQEIRGLLS